MRISDWSSDVCSSDLRRAASTRCSRPGRQEETGRSPAFRTVGPMETCIVRVWLPDRPGALGEVATAIGAVQAEIVGIDILERCAGRALDELAVQPHHAATVPRLVSSLRAVPRVATEDLRLLAAATHAPRTAALETAAALIRAPDTATPLEH